MIIDSKNFKEGGKVFEHDICIIGSGAAGISIAKELGDSKLSVALVESGGLKFNMDMWNLNAGKWAVSGLGQRIQADHETKNMRLRWLGGCTNHWGGFCSPFDKLDFEKRDWIPNNYGWPITLDDLEPYYERACNYVNVPSFKYDVEREYKNHPERPIYDFGEDSKITTKMFHFATGPKGGRRVQTNFGEKYLEYLRDSKNISVYLYGTVRKINADSNGKNIKSVDIQAFIKDLQFKIKAKHFVLATGGLENVRLLLNSNDVQKKGLGNHNDLVGRYFMGHAHFALNAGLVYAIETQKPGTLLPLYTYMIDPIRKHKTFGFFVIKDHYQKKYKLLNANIGGIIWTEPYKLSTDADKNIEPVIRMRSKKSAKDQKPIIFRSCQVNVEQDPMAESRVTLQDSLDRFGDRKLQVEAKVSDLQQYTALKSFAIFGQELSRSGFGAVRIQSSSKRLFDSILPSLGGHHIGSTRMANDAKKGVVDKNCKVFDINNLFIAGSSVFASGSCVNPTFTITALAIRLADHLKKITTI